MKKVKISKIKSVKILSFLKKKIKAKKMQKIQSLLKKKVGSWFGKEMTFDDDLTFFKKGFTIIPNSLLDCNILTNNEKIVLMNLLRFAFQGQTCFPSLRTLSEKSGLSRPSVITAIKKLEHLYFVKIEKKQGDTNVYKINVKIFNNF